MAPEPTEQAKSTAARFGRRIRRARYASGQLQRAVAREAGVSQATISRMELGGGATVSLGSWIRVATAVGLDWDFISPSESHRDRQAVQSRCHRLVAAVAAEGGWISQTLTHPTDPGRTETVLERLEHREIAIVRVWDVVGHVPAAIEELRDRLALERRDRPEGLRVSGAVVVVATGHNRRRLTETYPPVRHSLSFPGGDWIMALRRFRVPMPDEVGIIWTDDRIERLRPHLPYLDARHRNRSMR
jgi:transcriptional regulator with XRE-family HTH domain